MNLYDFFLSLHSWVRWLVLILAFIAIYRALVGWAQKKERTGADVSWTGRFAMIMNIQFVLGLLLLFISPKVQGALDVGMSAIMKDDYLRSLIIEHPVGMIAALALVHIGKSKAKKAQTDVHGHKTTAIFFIIAMLILLATIPWQTSELFRGF